MHAINNEGKTEDKDRPNQLSPAAQALLKLLSEEQRSQIKRDYPFKAVRNRILRDLAQKGACHTALAELSGLSRKTISYICFGYTYKM